MNIPRNEYVPLDVPTEARANYLRNYRAMTNATGRLMLFAGDQKMEHLNDDFFGEDIHTDDADPEHLFKIASMGVSVSLPLNWGLSPSTAWTIAVSRISSS